MTVTIPYDPFDWKPLAWAKLHCPSYITNFSYNTATIDYCFGNETNAAFFRNNAYTGVQSKLRRM